MKTAIIPIALLVLGLGLASGCAKKQPPIWESINNPEVVAQLKSFVAQKEAQAKADGASLPPDLKKYFEAAARGDWLTVSNSFEDFRNRAGQPEHSGWTDEWLHGKWQAIVDTFGAMEAFGEGDEKYSVLFAKDIIESIPAGGIYFGGTDPGWFLVTVMQKNQAAGAPFFAVPQHGLENATQLDYLRAMCGGKIYTPTADDLQRCFQDYTNDAARRLQNHQLQPGEDVKLDANGRVQISGYTVILGIRAQMTKLIFDQNSNREFYVEETFPLEWMYPYLEPHGLIMKINRQPVADLSDEIIQRDHDYWTQTLTPMIGGWLNDGTAIKDITAFAEKIFGRHDYRGFTGDPRFVENAYSEKMFSKERGSIAGLYAWRARQTKDAAERKRMNAAADFAFRQAWALCPDSPETVVRYVNLLTSENKFSDALLVAQTAETLQAMKGQNGGQIGGLVDAIKTMQRQAAGR